MFIILHLRGILMKKVTRKEKKRKAKKNKFFQGIY